MNISIIVAMSDNRVIGINNSLPWHLPDDLANFKRLTSGKTIIMGRKTYESLPGILPNRKHIVLTNSENYQPDRCKIVNSIDRAIELCKNEDEIFFIGGSVVFQESLRLANKIYLTQVHVELVGDTFFPEFNMDDWLVVESIIRPADNQHKYTRTFKVLEKLYRK